MPYKDITEQKKSQHEYYANNKDKAKESLRRRRKEYVEWFLEVKSSLSCSKCPEDHPGVLDFHHKDPKEKEGTISRMVNACRRKDKILAEIEKCEILCSNCHRKLHWNIYKQTVA